MERESAEVGGRARGGGKEGFIYKGAGFAVLSHNGGCSVECCIIIGFEFISSRFRLCRKGLNFSNFLSEISDRICSDLLAMNVFSAINVPAILGLSLLDIKFRIQA